MMHRTHIAGTPTWLYQWFLFVLIVAHPTNQQRLILVGSRCGCGSDGFDLACEKLARIEDPQLLRRVRIPQTGEEPNGDANLNHAKAYVIPVPRVHRHILFPEISECLAGQEANNHNQHRRLT